MGKLAQESRIKLQVRDAALQITQHLPSKDKRSESLAFYYWVLHNIRYVEDIAGVETIQAPEVTLERRSGDCDCMATLLASLHLAVNIPIQFVKVGLTSVMYTHVLCRSFPHGLSCAPIMLDPVAGRKMLHIRTQIHNGGLAKFYPIMHEGNVSLSGYDGRLVQF